MKRSIVVRTAAVAVAVLVVGELAARLLAPYLAAPELYADASTAVKVAQLDELATQSRCATVTALGNSMTRDDLVPAEFAAQLDGPVVVYNAALDAASPELLRDWMALEVEPALDPDLVILGVSSFDLSAVARVPNAARSSFDRAPLTRTDGFGRLQRPLVEQVALFRHRNELRDPVEVWRGLTALVGGDRAPQPSVDSLSGVLGPDGSGRSRRDLTYTPSPAATVSLQQDLVNDFRISPERVAALEGLITDLRDNDSAVALVALPVTSQYIEAHPRGRADLDAVLDQLQRTGEETGVPVLDLVDWASDSDFADTHHLAGPAADRFSAELPRLLTEAGVALPRC